METMTRKLSGAAANNAALAANTREAFAALCRIVSGTPRHGDRAKVARAGGLDGLAQDIEPVVQRQASKGLSGYDADPDHDPLVTEAILDGKSMAEINAIRAQVVADRAAAREAGGTRPTVQESIDAAKARDRAEAEEHAARMRAQGYVSVGGSQWVRQRDIYADHSQGDQS